MKSNLYKSLALLTLCFVGLTAQAGGQDDWQKVTSSDGTLSTSLPQTWVLSDDASPRYQEEYEKLKKNNPRWAKKLSERPQNSILTAYDLQMLNEGKSGVFLVIKSASGGLTPAMYGDVAKEIGKQMPLKGKLSSKVIDLPIGKTLSYWGTLKIKTDDSPEKELDLLAYMVVKGEQLYILQFMCDGGGLNKERREVYEKVAKTASTSS